MVSDVHQTVETHALGTFATRLAVESKHSAWSHLVEPLESSDLLQSE